jgi:hypothetical protein
VSEASRERKDAGAKDERGVFSLSEEHRMLLDIRDTLYEGCWDDFTRDLEARRRAQPHVFETVPDSPGMAATIGNHLVLIGEMRKWEEVHGLTLRGDANAHGHDRPAP